MAVEKKAVGRYNIAEELRGRWEVAAGWEQRTRGAGLGCRRPGLRPSTQY